MGFLDKIMFWKKHDDFDFDKAVDQHTTTSKFDLGLEKDVTSAYPTGLEEKSPFQEQLTPLSPEHLTTPTAQGENKDLQLINSKLDTLKALLNSIDQRMSNLERGDKKEKLW